MNTKRGAVSNNIGELNTTKYRTSLIINSKTPKIMKPFLFIIFIITNTISAQIVTFNGQILDLITKEPIEYAHVSFKDFGSFGTSTNENGGFTLIVEQKYLDSKVFISCLGYEDRLVNTSELQNKSFYLILLGIIGPVLMVTATLGTDVFNELARCGTRAAKVRVSN